LTEPNALRPMESYAGTDRLGRALTDPEKHALAALLRAHDFVGACMVAMRFAYKLTHSVQAAQDLMGRVRLRLVRVGWDPRDVPLVKRLCRLVWSEWTHELEESATARHAEQVFLEQMDRTAPSPEDIAARIQAELDADARATAHIDRLRTAFEAAGDEMNLLWLKYSLDEITSIAEMSDLSGRPPSDFYDAADRRKRIVKKILAATRAATRGASPEKAKT
jgi:hypothetical protein